MNYLNRLPCYLCRWGTNEKLELLEHLRDSHGRREIAGDVEKMKDAELERRELEAKRAKIPLRLYFAWPSTLSEEIEKSEEVYRLRLRKQLCRTGIVIHWKNARTTGQPTME